MLVKLLSILLFLVALLPLGQERYKEQREQMVDDQIEARGITNWRVLQSMRKVPRHQFVPQDQRSRAYYDGALPIGHGQTISQPFIVGYMTEMLQLTGKSKVLEIGTGSGYQAAVLAEIVEEVYTIEIIPALGDEASERLDMLGYENIHAKVSDGYHGWEEHAPFDAIMVTAASETIPPPLIRQLKDGGRMIIPVGSPFRTQYLVYITKKGEKVSTKNVMPVRFVPFTRSGDDNK